MYDREMRSVDWGDVFERQQLRRREVGLWLDALGLTPRTRLLDLGAGPGFASLEAARRLGREGRVIAVDRRDEALAFLRREVEKMGEEARASAPIETMTADAEAFTLPEPAQAALLTHVLHHTESPRRVLNALFQALAPGGRAIVAEFDPAAAGDIGPPLEERIAPDDLEEWIKQAGFAVERFITEGPEQYAFLVRRP